MQFIYNGIYICDVKNFFDIVVQFGYIRFYVVEKENLFVFLVWVVVGIVIVVVLGFILFISMILVVFYRRKNFKWDYIGCSILESLLLVKQVFWKFFFDIEGFVKSLFFGFYQGLVIYVQLDYFGGYYSDKINKLEFVVYVDI